MSIDNGNEQINKRHLPVAVRSLGGNVISVLEWPQHQSLARRDIVALGYMIRQIPGIAESIESVDKTVDLKTHFGASLDKGLADLIEEYSVDIVHLGYDYLVASGRRSLQGVTSEEEYNPDEDPADLMRLLQFIVKLQSLDIEVSGVAHLNDIVYNLGGFEEAVEMNSTELKESLSRAYDSSDDIIEDFE